MSTSLSSTSVFPEKLKHTYKSKSKSKGEHKSKEPSKAKSKGKEKQKNQISTFASVLRSDLSSDEEEPPLPSAAFAPPGAVLLNEVVDTAEFDYDTLKDNEDLEIWVLRVPDGVKPKHLSHLSLSLPRTQASTSQKVGLLSRKSGAYDAWSIPPTSSVPTSEANNEEAEEDVNAGSIVGGEELLGMNVMVPRRKKGGRLFVAPKPIKHHLVLTAQPTLPTPPTSPDSSSNATTGTYKSPARYQHPKHLLKHCFIPTGAGLRVPPALAPSTQSTEAGTAAGDGVMDASTHVSVDNAGDFMHKEKKQKKNKAKAKDGEDPGQESPRKKRKAEVEGKKAKKAKTES